MVGMKISIACLIVLCLFLTLVLTGCGDGSAEGGGAQRMVLVSGGQSGVYYPTAGAIARLANQADANLRIDVQTSGGSVANARALGMGDAHLAMMQNDIAAYVRNGEQMFDEAIGNIVGVAALYPEHIQVVARADSGIDSIADLEGKRIAIGAIGSGTEANALQILAVYGLGEADLSRVERLKASESRDYLQDNRVDAAFFTFGVGTAAIQELGLISDIKLVPIAGAQRQQLLKKYPFYRAATIPAGSYKGVHADVPTVSVMATLVARDDVPAEAIGAVLAGLFDNLDSFRSTHARLKRVNVTDAQANLTMPMHLGAKAFYERRAAAAAE